MPPAAAVTATVTVQELSAGMVPADKVTVDDVSVATPPVQVVAAAGVAEITTPLGIVSTSAAVSAAGTLLAFDKVITSVDVPPALIVAGLKALPIDGATIAGAFTVNVATAGPALFPFVVCNAPVAIELM